MSLQPEDVAQHTLGVVMIAHALCEIDEHVYGLRPPTRDVLIAALYHDAAESILTDIITPVKKFNPEMAQAFSQLEALAERQMVHTLPAELKESYQNAFDREREPVKSYVHAADKLDALCKCKQEVRRGNQEFSIAEQQILKSCEQYAAGMPAVQYFMDVFLPAFDKSIDEYRYLQP